MESSRVCAATAFTGTDANAGHTWRRSSAHLRYSSLGTAFQGAFSTSATRPRGNTATKLSTKVSSGGGSSSGTRPAVGCARNIVFSVSPNCCSSGGPVPRNTFFQHARPRDNVHFVAGVRFWYNGCSRPPHRSFASAYFGKVGRGAHKQLRHSQHIQTDSRSSPTPADAIGTRRVWRSQRYSGYSGCVTDDASSSSGGIKGQRRLYRST